MAEATYSQSEMDEVTDERDSLRRVLAGRESEVDVINARHNKELKKMRNEHFQQVMSLAGEVKDIKRHFVELQLYVEQQLDGGTLSQMQELDQGFRDLLHLMSKSTSRVSEAEQRAALERRRSEWLHWELQNIKGNIRVFCRVRPCAVSDVDERLRAVHLSEGESVTVVDVESSVRKIYNFDRVYGPEVTQDDVFADVRELVEASFEGFNCCMISYGQAGSGKTHTMVGTQSQPGVMVHALRTLKRKMDEQAAQLKKEEEERSKQQQEQQQQQHHHQEGEEERGDEEGGKRTMQPSVVRVGLLEIVNDKIYDLIGEHIADRTRTETVKKRTALDIRQDPLGIGVDQVEVALTDIDKMVELFNRSIALRAQTRLAHDYESSRGHVMMTVRVEGECLDGRRYRSTMHMVDLAAFERHSGHGGGGGRSKYAKYINQSLCTLQDVITALQNKESHVPFRRNKLTHLLQDSLSGNCKLLMMITVSPKVSDLKDTFGTLAFARSARAIELGGVRREVENEWTRVLRQQRHRVEELEAQLVASNEEIAALKNDIKRLERQRVDGQSIDVVAKVWLAEKANLIQQRDMLMKTVQSLTQRVLLESGDPRAIAADRPNSIPKSPSHAKPGNMHPRSARQQQQSQNSSSINEGGAGPVTKVDAATEQMPPGTSELFGQMSRLCRILQEQNSVLQQQLTIQKEQTSPRKVNSSSVHGSRSHSAVSSSITSLQPPSQQQQHLLPPAISEGEQLWRQRCMELKNLLAQKEEKTQAMQTELRLQMMSVKALVQKCNELAAAQNLYGPKDLSKSWGSEAISMQLQHQHQQQPQ